jgi:ribosomal protein L16 Arg81 hydroxylase
MLFEDFPELRQDFEVPVYCKSGRGDLYQINAWIGPENTKSPLHFDPNPNLFCQITGRKYFRIYDKNENCHPHPNWKLKNTSQVDIENVDIVKFPNFNSLNYWEFEVSPGEIVFIPLKFWHFVKSLEPSISINFWFR